MTKSVAEQFADIIEGLILAIEAQINGAPIPNRMASPMIMLVRKSLERLSSSFAAAIARIGQAVLPPPVREPRAQPRARAPAKPLTWAQRVLARMPAWLGGPASAPERPAYEHPQPIQQPEVPAAIPPRLALPRARSAATPRASSPPEPTGPDPIPPPIVARTTPAKPREPVRSHPRRRESTRAPAGIRATGIGSKTNVKNRRLSTTISHGLIVSI